MDNNRPCYPLSIQIYESPEECDKNIDAAVLTDVAAHIYFEEMNGFESDDDSSDSSAYANIYGGSSYILPLPPKNWQYFATRYPCACHYLLVLI